jgi:CHAT domain
VRLACRGAAPPRHQRSASPSCSWPTAGSRSTTCRPSDAPRRRWCCRPANRDCPASPRGNELMGLASALFALGTRTLVASVVPVPDAATRPLVLTSAAGSVPGLPPSAALAKAQAGAATHGLASMAAAAGFVCFGADRTPNEEGSASRSPPRRADMVFSAPAAHRRCRTGHRRRAGCRIGCRTG